MPCYSPLTAYQCSNGDVVFVDTLRRNDVTRTLSLPCGQCIGCRLERSRQWAVRCMHEASIHGLKNSFVTLTYADDKLPHRGNLNYVDFQRFMKRLRKWSDEPIRFYMCGEYGPETWRPHYHACLFGVYFNDRKLHGKGSEAGFDMYHSPVLERLWGHGFATCGNLSFESAAYVARYCVQKVTGENAESHYARCDELGNYSLVPEFNRMSLKPGIGSAFYRKWKSDMYPHDYIIVNGKEMKPPKYYDKLFAKDEPAEWDQLQWAREMEGRSKYEDNTEDRLRVKAIVATARADLLKRNIA